MRKILTGAGKMSGIGTVFGFFHGQYDAYSEMLERMEEHDKRVIDKRKGCN